MESSESKKKDDDIYVIMHFNPGDEIHGKFLANMSEYGLKVTAVPNEGSGLEELDLGTLRAKPPDPTPSTPESDV